MPGEKFQNLVGIMARLRGPDGCPWDREQTFDTIKSYLLEETYEVIDAIDRRDWPELAAELGDLQLQVVFFSQMAAEESRFTIDDVLDRICGKLIRRHPHVFGDETARTAGEVLKRWNELKAEEKGPQASAALLDSVPRTMPALMEAYQLTSRASQVGFDWQRFEDLLEKLEEELGELEEARRVEAARAGSEPAAHVRLEDKPRGSASAGHEIDTRDRADGKLAGHAELQDEPATRADAEGRLSGRTRAETERSAGAKGGPRARGQAQDELATGSEHEMDARARIEEELGDLLFMMVNIVRFLKFDPEMALRKTNRKFRERFAQVEQGLRERGKTFEQTGIEEMEELWQQAKKK